MLLVLLMLSCTPEQKSIEYGSDRCEFCKMTVVDRQHAAEVVTSKGKVYVFDAIECMVNYIDKREDSNYAFLLVNNYEKPGELMDAKTSHFLISKAIPSPMGAYLSAFENKVNARKMQLKKSGNLYDWKGVQEKITGTPISKN